MAACEAGPRPKAVLGPWREWEVAWPWFNPTRSAGTSGSACALVELTILQPALKHLQGLLEMVLHPQDPKQAVSTALRKGGETRAGPSPHYAFPSSSLRKSFLSRYCKDRTLNTKWKKGSPTSTGGHPPSTDKSARALVQICQ